MISKGKADAGNRRKTDNIMIKIKWTSTDLQLTIYRNLKIEEHEPG
jgi:hypothetical protein